jgi:uncharacterized protein
MDITPVIPQGKSIIKGYGDMAFKINDGQHLGSVIILPDKIESWPVKNAAEINVESLAIVAETPDVEILLIGCGEVHIPMPKEIQTYFSAKNIGVEIMTTGAACRTYNVLLGEGRDVAVALVAV